MDNLTPEQRRYNMQKIRSQDTEPERIVMKELRRRKIYFAKNVKTIIGKPDIVFRRKRVAVFIDSDFWHGHRKRGILPKSNVQYWKTKIDNNRARDKRVNRELRNNGWIVVRFWEFDIRNDVNKVINKLIDCIKRDQE